MAARPWSARADSSVLSQLGEGSEGKHLQATLRFNGRPPCLWRDGS